MRQNKPFSVITYTKDKEPEQQYHCKYHTGCRMVRIATGLHCQICGGTEIATKTVFTFNNPSAQEPVI